MAGRLTVVSDFGHKTLNVRRRSSGLKRKAWMAVFAGSALFWAAVAVVVWQIWG